MPPFMLLKDYQNIPAIEKCDNVVRRFWSLEMAHEQQQLKVKQEQLMNKTVVDLEDTSSLEAGIVALSVKICNYEEHMHKLYKDKAHKHYVLVSINQRKKMLKNLPKTRYSVFQKLCKQGDGVHLPPLRYEKAHCYWLTRRDLYV